MPLASTCYVTVMASNQFSTGLSVQAEEAFYIPLSPAGPGAFDCRATNHTTPGPFLQVCTTLLLLGSLSPDGFPQLAPLHRHKITLYSQAFVLQGTLLEAQLVSSFFVNFFLQKEHGPGVER